MVEQVDVEEAAGGEGLGRQLKVVRRGRRVAARMVVHEDQGAGVRTDGLAVELATRTSEDETLPWLALRTLAGRVAEASALESSIGGHRHYSRFRPERIRVHTCLSEPPLPSATISLAFA
jgi:hypothetical protein